MLNAMYETMDATAIATTISTTSTIILETALILIIKICLERKGKKKKWGMNSLYWAVIVRTYSALCPEPDIVT